MMANGQGVLLGFQHSRGAAFERYPFCMIRILLLCRHRNPISYLVDSFRAEELDLYQVFLLSNCKVYRSPKTDSNVLIMIAVNSARWGVSERLAMLKKPSYAKSIIPAMPNAEYVHRSTKMRAVNNQSTLPFNP